MITMEKAVDVSSFLQNDAVSTCHWAVSYLLYEVLEAAVKYPY
jgi:hypothetical protein